jgi:sensor domain CHASE-containing protein
MISTSGAQMAAPFETEFVVAWTRNLLRLLSLKNAPMAISALLIVICGLFADHQNRQLFEERSRTAVLSELSVIRAKL